MVKEEFFEILKENRFICAVKDEAGLMQCVNNNAKVVFVLYGSIINICDIVRRLKEAEKTVFVHIDLIEGLSAKEVAVEFVANNTGADGIISTKQTLIKSAAAHGLLTVQRFFLIDSLALENLKKQLNAGVMDIVEVLPACCFKTITLLSQLTDKPIIASGMIADRNDVLEAIQAGAAAVSGTNYIYFE